MYILLKKIPIGISDFKKVIDDNYHFVDKSLFIKEFWENNSSTILITRPRRFGKTLNMSMIRYFFDNDLGDTSYLFKGLEIENYSEIMNKQGKYPVIFVSFKDLKDLTFDSFLSKVKSVIAEEYKNHRYIIEKNFLSKDDEVKFKKILFEEGNLGDYELSLMQLSRYLSKYHNKKVMIFIDEYDVPVQAGFSNGYYDEVISFMRNMLSAAFKDNVYLEKGLITGILRVAKESVFSGLNNLEVCGLTEYNFCDKFGFTEKEVNELLKLYGIETHLEGIKNWYNGYIFGDKVIYNPWSVLNYINKPKEGLRPYWVNTSSNDLVNIFLAKGSQEVKKDLESLIEGSEICKIIDSNVIMKNIEKTSDNLWSFLLFTGYLKTTNKTLKEGNLVCKLAIPNKEVLYLYNSIITNWFNESIGNDKYNMMLSSLVNGDIKIFEKLLRQFVLNSISYFDVGGYEGEKVYHAFVLGLLVSLNSTHEIISNRESGYGRYDIMIIPRDISKLGIIIEFKKLDIDDTESLEDAAHEALNQIEKNKYDTELIYRGIKNIKKLGIVFKGKEVLVKES